MHLVLTLNTLLAPTLGSSASCFLLPRLGQTLSVRGEDTGEHVFSEALGRAVGQWPGAKLLDHGWVESRILGKLFYWLTIPHPYPPRWETSRKEERPSLLCCS